MESQESSILERLRIWQEDLPGELGLYDETGRRIYQKEVSEMHVVYFAIIIIYFSLFGDQRLYSPATLTSLAASSCMTSLYEEIYVRDDVNYLLGMNVWYLMLAAVPQLLYSSVSAQATACHEALAVISNTLEQMQIKCVGAASVVDTINRHRAGKQPNDSASFSQSQRSRRPIFGGMGSDMRALQALFPFPRDFNPRIADLLDDSAPAIAADTDETGVNDDFGWILDEFWSSAYNPFGGDDQ